VNCAAESAECLHGMCSACQYEDCACECHLVQITNLDQWLEMQDDEEFQRNGFA
jgi:hypothetical protein